MLPRIIACVLVVGWVSSSAAADRLGFWATAQPLTTAKQVRDLSAEMAGTKHPVRLIGVVTHVNPHTGDFFVQDATAGVYVHPSTLAAKLAPGDRIELEGTTYAGEFAPDVVPSRLRVIETGAPLPEPLPFNLSAEDARWLYAQYVEVWVTVHGVSTDLGATRIEVDTPRNRGVLLVPGEQHATLALELRGATVKVRGVCVPTFKDRMVAGRPQILLAELPTLPTAVVDAPPDSPVQVIETLLQFSPTPHPGGQLVKIAGVVTALPLPGMAVVQDHSGGAAVWTDLPVNDIAIGMRVEAVGTLRIDGRRVGLKRSAIKVYGPGVLPDPVLITPGELVAGGRALQLVQVEGRVEQVRELSGWSAITLVDGAARFEVYSPGRADQYPVARGSRVAVVGVPVEATPDGTPAGVAGVFLNGPEAITLLEAPPPTSPKWWTTGWIGYLVGGLMGVVLLACVWVLMLRARMRGATGEIQRQYEERAKLETRLRQAAKLEAVGRLAGGIAHDFNNLLTVINGCAELLVDVAADDGGRMSELAVDIRHAGERAAGLTGQLLTFSRKREVLVTAVRLNDVVGDTVRLLERVIGENIRVQTALVPDLPAVRGEPGLLHQVIMNLAVNAKDAMPHGGTLTLTTSLLTEPKTGLDGQPLPGAESRRSVRLTATDTGIGMTDEVKARIFEPYFTTKEVGEGTGLGLATVYGIVQTLGGRIQVDSTVGRGTTFHIDLRIHGEPVSDLTQTPAPRTLPTARVVPVTKLAGVTVLVVEDNEMVRNLLVTGLTADGATVLAADRPEHAFRVLAIHSGRLDILLTDVVMPGMSGRALADRVKAERPGTRVVYMSGYTADEVLRQGVLEEEVEFLQKPFTPDHLTARLLRVLAGEPTS